MKKNLHFTIYNDFIPQYDDIRFSIYSVWNVERDKEYISTIDGQDNNFYSLIRTIEGEGIIKIKNEEYVVKPGDLIIVRYYDVVSYRPKTDSWGYYWINFYSTCKKVPYFKLNKNYNIPFEEDEINNFSKMFKIMQVYNELNVRIVNAMFEALYFSWMKYDTKNEDKSVKFSKYIENALYYLNNNLTKNISVEELSEKCFLSIRRFRDVFKKEVGMSPKEYIKKKRLEEVAYMLLTTNNTLESIATDLNYSSSYYMISEFKKHYGITPKNFRKQRQIK